MRKYFYAAAVMIVLMAAAVPNAAAAPANPQQVTGFLEGLEESEKGWILTLWVDGVMASAPLNPSCVYYVDREKVSREVFAERAQNEQVTVEFRGRGNDIVLCRAAIIRAQ